MSVLAGAAVVDITPPAGLPMAGFGIRTDPAEGTHDPLTARALVVDDTALLVADVIGLDARSCERIRTACGLPPANVVIAASHTHGGPHTMPGRMGGAVNDAYLAALEQACVAAIETAFSGRQPARLRSGQGDVSGVARNRRRADGPVDTSVPVLRVEATNGATLAVLFSFACHPVVLDGTNRLWTADYPFHARRAVEAACPGAVAIFATGCAGDVNTGHSAHSSLSLSPGASRSQSEASRIGAKVADATLAAPLHDSADAEVAAARHTLALQVERREGDNLDHLCALWATEQRGDDPAKARIRAAWLHWAVTAGRAPLAPYPVRVAALRWGDIPLIALPGEIFAQTALQIRSSIPGAGFVLCYCDDNPGYIAPAGEFARGGYEIDEAHRYYGMPGTFAKGGAERIRDAALSCMDRVMG